MADFKGLRYYFIVFLSLFSFPFALLLVEAVPLLMRFKQINPKQFFRTWCWFCVDVRMSSVAVNFVNRSPSSFSLSICIFYSMNIFFMFFISWQEQMLTDFLFVKSLQSLVSKLCYSFRSSTEHLRWINLQSSRVGIVHHFLILKVTK